MGGGGPVTELQGAMRLLSSPFPSCVSGPINFPIFKGQPNPAHGKFFVVGSVPMACHGVMYTTEEDAIAALQAAGATRIQRVDCSFVPTTKGTP